jgi:hypothetical protein
MKQIVGIKHLVYNCCIKTWKVNVPGAGRSVYKIFISSADVGMPVHDVAKPQECTAEASDISTESVQRISEGNIAICISISLCEPPAFFRVGEFSLAIISLEHMAPTIGLMNGCSVQRDKTPKSDASKTKFK